MCLRPYLWPLYREFLRQGDAPILAGPFYGEIGFEALYWIPFVHAVAHRLRIPSDRVIPISRGGAACWYGTPSGIELYGMRSPQELRVATAKLQRKTGLAKQTHVTAFDRAIYADVAHTLSVRAYRTLHPAWMYQTLRPFYAGERGLDWLSSHLLFATTVPPPLPDGLKLPERFVAARFYYRPTFPNHPMVQSFIEGCLRKLAQKTVVIHLDHPAHFDEHFDAPIPDIPNVQRLSQLFPTTIETNLAVSSAVLARSTAFAGSYGGFAQLALRFGKPSVSFYADWHSTALAHRHLSEALAHRMNIPFRVLSLGELPLLQDVVPTVIMQNAGSSASAPILRSLETGKDA